ncbi:MAG: hypothetical protein EOO04_34640, partial [Chitinophagaceae bacterium]
MSLQTLNKILTGLLIFCIVLLIFLAVYLTASNTLTIAAIIVDVIILGVEGLKAAKPVLRLIVTVVGLILT